MHQILTAMDNDWRECVNIERQLYAMTVTAGVSHFSFNVMMSLYTMAGIFYLLGNYALRFLRLVEVYNDTLRQLPIRIQFPFDTEQSPIFELLVVILILHVMLDVYTVAILNSLIFTLVSLATFSSTRVSRSHAAKRKSLVNARSRANCCRG